MGGRNRIIYAEFIINTVLYCTVLYCPICTLPGSKTSSVTWPLYWKLLSLVNCTVLSYMYSTWFQNTFCYLIVELKTSKPCDLYCTVLYVLYLVPKHLLILDCWTENFPALWTVLYCPICTLPGSKTSSVAWSLNWKLPRFVNYTVLFYMYSTWFQSIFCYLIVELKTSKLCELYPNYSCLSHCMACTKIKIIIHFLYQ